MQLDSCHTIHKGIIQVLNILLVGSITACSSDSTPASNAESPEVHFTEVTAEVGLADFEHENGDTGNKWYPEMMGSGAGFIDYDGDGWEDILLLGGGYWDGQTKTNYQALWLYRNQGDGTFKQTTSEAGLADIVAYSIGVTVADYDNDGDQDFFLSNLGINMLFQNNKGVFTEVGKQAGLSEHWEWSSSAMFFDANRDGWLDLYAGNYVEWTPETDRFCPEGGTVKIYCLPAHFNGLASRFYINNGNGTFTDKTKSAGFLTADEAKRDKSLGVTELDYNNDGWSDMIVVCDGEADQLYENNGDGTFTERGVISGMAFSEHGEARAGMGVDAAIVDSSGLVSIFVGNFSQETVGVYKHNGNGLFMDRASTSKIGFPSLMTLTFGLFLADVDLDTDLDLFAANGHVNPDRLVGQDKITFRQPSQLYLNRGNGVFDEFTQENGVLAQAMVARGAAYADYDRDGDLDILITENDGPVHLWRNDIENASYLRVQVEGRLNNRDGIGTKITAVVNGLHMERRVRTGSSYLSSSEKTVTFGLGTNSQVDSLLIEWPGNKPSLFTNIQGNQMLRFVEGSDEPIQVSN